MHAELYSEKLEICGGSYLSMKFI